MKISGLDFKCSKNADLVMKSCHVVMNLINKILKTVFVVMWFCMENNGLERLPGISLFSRLIKYI